MINTIRRTIPAILLLLAMAACRKHETAAVPASCTSTLYGFTMAYLAGTGAVPAIYGTIAATSGLLTPIAGVSAHYSSLSGVHNPTDNCYYFFSSPD